MNTKNRVLFIYLFLKNLGFALTIGERRVTTDRVGRKPGDAGLGSSSGCRERNDGSLESDSGRAGIWQWQQRGFGETEEEDDLFFEILGERERKKRISLRSGRGTREVILWIIGVLKGKNPLTLKESACLLEKVGSPGKMVSPSRNSLLRPHLSTVPKTSVSTPRDNKGCTTEQTVLTKKVLCSFRISKTS